ncbi:MAG: hypothetical protein MAG551_02636 [Candidatus Scalindua arabica]|uniref:Uncharacterized protein n=1 Tax=Candidatus Scalindua arabica TaxID=1127984 RepID=A0A941W5D0_9BACT|nr:hypothetical protein [Candidatus Scalindua arabica]
MGNNTLNNQYILYSINVEDAQAVANEIIDRDLTDSEIKKVEARLGDYLPNWFDLLEMAIDDVVEE